MSKSTQRPYHVVGLLDDADIIWASIRRAVTDAGREIRFGTVAANVGVTNLLTIYQALSGQSQQQIETHFAGKGYGELKRIVADLIIMTLGPIQECYYALMDDQTALDVLLQKGADTARERAAVMLHTAKERVGLWALP
jgi:tryptophanyl-tRNA synthetase